MTPRQEARLIKAADDLHRVSIHYYEQTGEWKTLAHVLDEIKPLSFYRTSGEERPVPERAS